MESERGYPRKLRHIGREQGLWTVAWNRLFQEKRAEFPALTLKELESLLSYATENNFYRNTWTAACNRWPNLTVKERLNLIADGVLLDQVIGFDDKSVAQHIRVFLPHLGIHHHAVDIGNQRIIHFTGNIVASFLGLAESEVREEPLSALRRVKFVQIVEHVDALDPHVIIERARSQIGRRDYDLFDRNCEHFAQWAVTGIATSSQAEKVIGKQNRRFKL